MIEPKEIVIEDKRFIISKFPAVAGIEIAIKLMKSVQEGIDYKLIEEIMFKGMKFVSVILDNNPNPLILSTPALIDNHIKDWEMLGKLYAELLEYNCSFFQEGRISNLLKDIAPRIHP